MHIAVSTSPLVTGHKARGTGVYTRELVAALRKISDITISTFDDMKGIPASADLVHITHFDPFFLTLPMTLSKPMVITIHDLIPLVYPKNFPRGIRGELKWQIQRFGASRAARVITDSQTSKKDIMRFIHVNEDKVDVVPLAPRAGFSPVANPKILSEVIEKYSLPSKFALYVGDINWNKNVLGLLSAWHQYISLSPHNRGNTLVLVGGAFLDTNLKEANEISVRIHELDLDRYVVRVGQVEDVDLQAMYTLARVSVAPSYYEGFGFPVLESMACGGVVVASNTSSIAEISGPAYGIDPLSPTSIVEGLTQAMNISPQKRENIVNKGLEWASQFSWEKVAEQTVAVYNKALEK